MAITITTTYTDPATGDTVVLDGAGVEKSRTPGSPQTVVSTSIATKLNARLADLQAIIDRPAVTLADNNTGTIRQAIRDLQVEVQTLAKVDRLQTRRLLALLDADS